MIVEMMQMRYEQISWPYLFSNENQDLSVLRAVHGLISRLSGPNKDVWTFESNRRLTRSKFHNLLLLFLKIPLAPAIIIMLSNLLRTLKTWQPYTLWFKTKPSWAVPARAASPWDGSVCPEFGAEYLNCRTCGLCAPKAAPPSQPYCSRRGWALPPGQVVLRLLSWTAGWQWEPGKAPKLSSCLTYSLVTPLPDIPINILAHSRLPSWSQAWCHG